MSVMVNEERGISKDVFEFDQRKLELIRNTICKDATQEEYEVFVEICKATHLNPLFKQIYFIKRGGKPTHQTSIDGLRLIADRTKRYVPGREPTFTYDKDGHLISATSYVKKLAQDGTWHEVAATCMSREYNPGTGQWVKMPHVMLAKCAEAAALRRAFPADMLGIYSQDEMDQADQHDSHPRKDEVTIDAPQIVELISSEQAQDIENLIGSGSDSKEYRLNLLNYFSNRMNKKIDNFYKLPKVCFEPCMNSVLKRMESKKTAPPVLDMSKVNEEDIPF